MADIVPKVAYDLC